MVNNLTERKKVNSIIRAVSILKVISEGTNKLSVICKKLQLGKGTMHRILTTLEDTGMVRQDPVNRGYFLGPMVISLTASDSINHSFLFSCCQQEMLRLRDFSQETVNLQVRMGLQRICIGELESPNNIKYTAGTGAVQPIYLGSAGKMLLSEMADEDLKNLLDHICYDPVCINTITNKETMLEEIKKIREQGYAVSYSERLEGSACITVPVRHYPIPVAISVLGLENRFDKAAMKRCLNEMLESASRISNLLTRK
ncbi:MAG: IclR family transcriptional regulator [Deltaproteobacteria bacterium]|nr:IclR family transcriptional regulator [Deltaproteobacteria bacterium]